ncbi:hypothetical protein [Nocardia fusca]|uniref:Uncharacterized protein n=1 Tax=Nocardia fusca TaxID=941183 RepID=A0ABV3FII0_9NOCA
MAAQAAVDVRPVVDSAELIARWLLAWLGIPEQPDSFWANFSANTAEALYEYADVYANACAVMADNSQPIGMES